MCRFLRTQTLVPRMCDTRSSLRTVLAAVTSGAGRKSHQTKAYFVPGKGVVDVDSLLIGQGYCIANEYASQDGKSGV